MANYILDAVEKDDFRVENAFEKITAAVRQYTDDAIEYYDARYAKDLERDGEKCLNLMMDAVFKMHDEVTISAQAEHAAPVQRRAMGTPA